MYDWDTFYFEFWVENHDDGIEPTHEDYIEWMHERADFVMGK